VTAPLPVILASTSPYRRALLERIGLPHTAHAPQFDESDAEGRDAKSCALAFAEGKARSIADKYPGTLIIGSDQTLSLRGETFRKPRDKAEQLSQLSRLAGSKHELHAGVVLLDTRGDRIAREVATVELTMRPLETAALEKYLALDHPDGCVGGYTFERRGICLFGETVGADDSAVVGLPLMSLTRCFEALGFEIFDWLEPEPQSP